MSGPVGTARGNSARKPQPDSITLIAALHQSNPVAQPEGLPAPRNGLSAFAAGTRSARSRGNRGLHIAMPSESVNHARRRRPWLRARLALSTTACGSCEAGERNIRSCSPCQIQRWKRGMTTDWCRPIWGALRYLICRTKRTPTVFISNGATLVLRGSRQATVLRRHLAPVAAARRTAPPSPRASRTPPTGYGFVAARQTRSQMKGRIIVAIRPFVCGHGRKRALKSEARAHAWLSGVPAQRTRFR